MVKQSARRRIGATIRAARLERGHTQASLAKRAGIDRSYLGAIERGEFNFTLDTLVRIARALDLTAAALMKRAKL
jgi:transcriptional regulator with XRE-family HTH domain